MAKQTAPVHESWLPEANQPTADFPLTHLPYGAFELEGQQHLCVAIGAHLLDLHACAASNLLPPTLVAACQAPSLNPFLSLGHRHWTLLRGTLTGGALASAVGSQVSDMISRSIKLADADVAPVSAADTRELAHARAGYFDALVDLQTASSSAESQGNLAAAKIRYNDARRSLGLDPVP